MRLYLILATLSACLANASSLSIPLQDIHSPNCADNALIDFCAQESSTYDRAYTVIGPPVVEPPLFADGSASGSASYGEIKANLRADGAYNGLLGEGPSAEAYFVGSISEKLYVPSLITAGDVWSIGFSLTATGESKHTLSNENPTGDDYTSDAGMSIGIPGAVVNCPTGANAPDLNGTVTLTCVASFALQPHQTVPISFLVDASARSEHGPASLDMSHTAKIDYIAVLDAQGNPDLNVEILSRSGFDYNSAHNAALSEAPEPKTSLLAAVSLLVICGLRYFRIPSNWPGLSRSVGINKRHP